MLKPVWVKCKWSAKDLDRQSIQFRLPIPNGSVSCRGEIWASRREVDDRISVFVSTSEPTGRGREMLQTVFALPESYANAIALHPDQNLFRFQLMMA
jgi:hypothetical protein